MSPIKRMTSAFSSAGDRSSRLPGGDMPLQNLKSLYVESPDLSIFTRAVAPCPPTAADSKTSAARTFAPITFLRVKWRVFEAPVGQKRTPAPGKIGRGDEKSGAFSQQPALGPSFIANTDFSFSRARTRARPAVGREIAGCARDAPGAKLSRFCPPNRGWGFGARHRPSEQPRW